MLLAWKNPLNCEQCELQRYLVEKSSLLHTNEFIQWRAMIVLTYRCTAAFWRPCITSSFIVPLYENEPYTTVFRWKSLRWGILIMPTALKGLIFLIREYNFFPLLNIPYLMISGKFQSRIFVTLKETWSLRTFEISDGIRSQTSSNCPMTALRVCMRIKLVWRLAWALPNFSLNWFTQRYYNFLRPASMFYVPYASRYFKKLR